MLSTARVVGWLLFLTFFAPPSHAQQPRVERVIPAIVEPEARLPFSQPRNAAERAADKAAEKAAEKLAAQERLKAAATPATTVDPDPLFTETPLPTVAAPIIAPPVTPVASPPDANLGKRWCDVYMSLENPKDVLCVDQDGKYMADVQQVYIWIQVGVRPPTVKLYRWTGPLKPTTPLTETWNVRHVSQIPATKLQSIVDQGTFVDASK